MNVKEWLPMTATKISVQIEQTSVKTDSFKANRQRHSYLCIMAETSIELLLVANG